MSAILNVGPLLSCLFFASIMARSEMSTPRTSMPKLCNPTLLKPSPHPTSSAVVAVVVEVGFRNREQVDSNAVRYGWVVGDASNV